MNTEINEIIELLKSINSHLDIEDRSWIQPVYAFGGVLLGYFLNELNNIKGNIRIYCINKNINIFSKEIDPYGHNKVCDSLNHAKNANFSLVIDFINNYSKRKIVYDIIILFKVRKNNNTIKSYLMKSTSNNNIYDEKINSISLPPNDIIKLSSTVFLKMEDIERIDGEYDIYIEYKYRRNKNLKIKLITYEDLNTGYCQYDNESKED